MKRLIVICFLSLLITILALTVLSNFDGNSAPVTYTYSGKVLLNNEKYNELKYLLANKEVVIGKLEVCSSEEHLVNFTAYVPAEIPFSFGEITNTKWKHTTLWDWAVGLTATSIFIILALLYSYI
jgi:hypothetical protein